MAKGPILVAAVDCKAIPIIKPGGALPVLRLTKGQKANRKRWRPVATVFTRQPWVRTPEQVQSLFRSPGREQAAASTPPRTQNNCVWASLTKGKTAIIQEVAEEMRGAIPRPPDPFGPDGERGATDPGRPHAADPVWRSLSLRCFGKATRGCSSGIGW